ncbi:MAG: RNA polymerase sigma-70 factor [Tannerella sp.]|jgi:RNA polymerase sigma-70 factor (ECF subfamily)|nr:RNA polymerase sigma-70 factor [Tannerella sp.]
MKTRKDWFRDASLNDEAAFRQMFEYYYSDLCVYAKRFIPDLDIREDIVQDVFCSIWINRKNIDFSLPMTNYLITSVKRHCLNYLRKQKSYDSDPDVIIENIPVYAEDHEDLFMLHELEDLLAKTLASLPEEYRIAFEMSKLEDRSTAEIAEKLGVSVRTVERYRNKAVEILQTQLKDYLPLIYLFLHIRF